MRKSPIQDTWDALLGVDYFCQQPGIAHGFKPKHAPRADTNPALNGQPWYHGTAFASVDPSQLTIPQKPKGRI